MTGFEPGNEERGVGYREDPLKKCFLICLPPIQGRNWLIIRECEDIYNRKDLGEKRGEGVWGPTQGKFMKIKPDFKHSQGNIFFIISRDESNFLLSFQWVLNIGTNCWTGNFIC